MQIISRLPQGIEPERFFLSVATCVQKNPALLNCDPNSVLLAAYESADLGVSLSPALQLGYLIPYGRVATFMLSYRGMIAKAYETGAVKNLYAEVVYENDTFVRQLAPRSLVHIPADDDRGERIGAYAFVEFHDGHIDFEYLTAKQIEKHKEKSKQQNSMMWSDSEFWEEGWRKTPIRVLAKRLPLANEKFERLIEQIHREAERETDLTPAPKDNTARISTTSMLKAKLKSSGQEIQTSDVSPVAATSPVSQSCPENPSEGQ